MIYFAYGSNMCTARLARRVPSVRALGPAGLSGHRLAWHLRGGDASGKCNVVATGQAADIVYGVLFELEDEGMDALHAAEGPAYEFVELPVVATDNAHRAAVYRGQADWLDDRLVPFDWYRDFVVTGARQHGLPDDWIAALANVAATTDPDAERARANRDILHEVPRNLG